MSKENSYLIECNKQIAEFEKVIKKPIINNSKVYYTGVDLGTAYIVLCVLDENKKPVAGAYEYANVIKDGMVVDYIGAIDIVRRLKAKLEKQLNTELIYAATAIPPGTENIDSGAVKNVVQAAGFEITSIVDEPTAANEILKIKDGAVVDIGGGTTGISILKNSKVIKVTDEPTGGTHFTLVVSGSYKKSFEEAEDFKKDIKHHKELIVILKPVIEKVSSIIKKTIEGYDVDHIYLVGGTCLLTGIEEIVEQNLKIPVLKPKNPMLITPLGIAKTCTSNII